MDIGLQKKLINLCELPVSQKWELNYRASRDGFDAMDFHKKCDGIANTLTVIKSENGNIFGGFTEQKWHPGWDLERLESLDRCVKDPKAFIFSLVNKEENPFKVMCSNKGDGAILCQDMFGPCFGIGDGDEHFVDEDEFSRFAPGHVGTGELIEDICVLGPYGKCLSNIGHAYKHPDYPKDTDRARNILAGSYEFKTVEVEVFAQTNQRCSSLSHISTGSLSSLLLVITCYLLLVIICTCYLSSSGMFTNILLFYFCLLSLSVYKNDQLIANILEKNNKNKFSARKTYFLFLIF